MDNIDSVSVRMYTMGTGDFFILKFFSGEKEKFKMMIDCGAWFGSAEKISSYVNDFKEYVHGAIDVLIITHEHKDHVHGFDACESLLSNGLEISQIWMAWTEEDKNPKVKDWKKDYGDKKKALALATYRLKNLASDPEHALKLAGEYNGESLLEGARNFSMALEELNDLQSDDDPGLYIGGLKGMKVVKEKIAKNNIRYFRPGEIIDNIPQLSNLKFYVLGPPEKYNGEVDLQEGKKGESYEHNKKLRESDAFAEAVLALQDGSQSAAATPFDLKYLIGNEETKTTQMYLTPENDWRKIDNDWLNSAGSLGLRINSLTNNLSLAFAIEFQNSGKVMLFPGDAEYGSWESWHRIPWDVPARNGKPHFTQDLLSRTVFYKVSHHLSHHGTAERLGMEMMTHPDLVAMATLDYSVIAPRWKGTMPNRALLAALLKQTKGRLIIMNEQGLYYDKDQSLPLSDKIKEHQKQMTEEEWSKFDGDYEVAKLYKQFVVKSL